MMQTILVAEDELELADMIAFKLEHSGYRVVRATNGEETLALARSERPDLVLLDVMMPVLTGFEVLARLRADPELKTLPVLMLTARGQERDVIAGLAAGASDYVVKPFSLKELVARIGVALRRS